MDKDISEIDRMRLNDPSIRKLVFLSSPYRGDTVANARKARDFCRLAVANGYAPIAPHLHNPQFMTDSDPWVECGYGLLRKCDEIWVLGSDSSDVTPGMALEIKFAFRHGIHIRFMTYDTHEDEVFNNFVDLNDGWKTYLHECDTSVLYKYVKQHITIEDEDARILNTLNSHKIESLARSVNGGYDSKDPENAIAFFKQLLATMKTYLTKHDEVNMRPGTAMSLINAIISFNTCGCAAELARDIVKMDDQIDHLKISCVPETTNAAECSRDVVIPEPRNFRKAETCHICANASEVIESTGDMHCHLFNRKVGKDMVCDVFANKHSCARSENLL